MKKVIIVGASHGGHQLAIDLNDIYKDIDITVYEESDFVSFMSCGMQLFLEDKTKSQNSVRNFDPETLNQPNIHVKNNSSVIDINKENKTIKVKNLKNNQIIEDQYDKLILCSGVTPRHLDDKEYENMIFMRGYNAASQIKQLINNDAIKNVSIIGSGYIGIEAAEVLTKKGKNVTLIDGEKYPLGKYLNDQSAKIIKNELENQNITLINNEHVKEFITSDNIIQKIITTNNEIQTDAVICAIGITPNTDWLKDIIELDQQGFIKINEYLQTTGHDIYALGDATKVYSIPANQPLSIALATVARSQAHYLAYHLFEDIPAKAYQGVVGSSALGVFDYNIASIGLTKNSAELLQIPIKSSFYTNKKRPLYVLDQYNNDVNIELVFNAYNHQLLGCTLLSKGDISELGHLLTLAIKQKLTLEEIMETDYFFQPNYDRQLNILVLAIRNALGYSEFY